MLEGCPALAGIIEEVQKGIEKKNPAGEAAFPFQTGLGYQTVKLNLWLGFDTDVEEDYVAMCRGRQRRICLISRGWDMFWDVLGGSLVCT